MVFIVQRTGLFFLGLLGLLCRSMCALFLCLRGVRGRLRLRLVILDFLVVILLAGWLGLRNRWFLVL